MTDGAHSLWVRQMAARVGLTVPGLAVSAGLSPGFLVDVAAGERSVDASHMGLITKVVLDGYDAREAARERYDPVAETPRTQAEWLTWARRRPGAPHVPVRELAHRTGLPHDLLALAELGEALLDSLEVGEVALALKVLPFPEVGERPRVTLEETDADTDVRRDEAVDSG
jgi:hypothetical protein